ncbi:MAG: hypothetical protein D6761_04745 [Candidatus Dadabacteria bacterium]|nr:MAG: hypothetical protein D6761_04745 [Candidatus Dadabacteria bacterium]
MRFRRSAASLQRSDLSPSKGAVRTVNTFVVRRLALIIAATTALVAAPVGANETSVRKTNEGIILLDQGKLSEARAAFTAALRADTSDEDARYYLAHTMILGSDFEKALKILGSRDFEFWDADYLRGIAWMNLGENEKAIASFERSIRRRDSDRARFNLGMLYYQAGDNAKARAQLEATRDGNLSHEDQAYRLLYLGLIDYAEGQQDRARGYFRQVSEDYADTAASELARDMLGEEGGAAAHGEGEAASSPFSAGLRLMVQYDNNVGLVQDNDNVAQIYNRAMTQSPEALRLGVFGNAGVRLGEDEGLQGGLGASLFIGMNGGDADNVSDFNVVQPRVQADIGWSAGNWGIRAPLLASVTMLGPFDDIYRYSTSYGGGLGGWWSPIDMLSVNSDLLIQARVYPRAGERDGTEIGLGLGATVVPIDRLRIQGGWRLTTLAEKQSNSPWGYLENGLHLGATIAATEKFSVSTGLRYAHRGFDGPFTFPDGSGPGRTDDEITASLGFRVQATDLIDVTAGYDYFHQNSVPAFTYTRQIVTLSVGFTF